MDPEPLTDGKGQVVSVGDLVRPVTEGPWRRGLYRVVSHDVLFVYLDPVGEVRPPCVPKRRKFAREWEKE